MFNSIIKPYTETNEQMASSSPPWVWVGFLFAGAFFTLEILFVFLQLDESSVNVILTIILIAGWIYWLVCVHRIHKILSELTHGRYPITPGQAAAFHFIPFYNFVWIFKWPIELSSYLNSRGRVKIIAGGWIGALLLLSFVVRLLDGAFGMACMFGVIWYVSFKVDQHVKSLHTLTPDQLPPLPDPAIFGPR
jgi:hypothetical protein